MPNSLVTNGWPKRFRSTERLELELEEVAVEVVNDVGFLEADPAGRLADQPYATASPRDGPSRRLPPIKPS